MVKHVGFIPVYTWKVSVMRKEPFSKRKWIIIEKHCGAFYPLTPHSKQIKSRDANITRYFAPTRITGRAYAALYDKTLIF